LAKFLGVNRRIDPKEIRALNEAVNVTLLEELVENMKENGWQGRPILVFETESEYMAWTGSHRIAAAIEVGLVRVPCYVLQASALSKEEFRSGCCNHSNVERVELVRNTGDAGAIELMEQER
jgi:hypothetical protein